MQPDGMPVDDFSMLEMMQILHHEIRMPDLEAQELVGTIGRMLRIKLSRLMSQQARSPAIGKPCSSVDAAIIHGLIGTGSKRFPSTAEMAEQFNTSRRSLLRLFKATTGTSPSRYVEEAKLDGKVTCRQSATEMGTMKMDIMRTTMASFNDAHAGVVQAFHRHAL